MSVAAEAWWWPYVMILVAGWIATDLWRWLGVIAAGRIRDDSEILLWVRAVATALVAGVIARLVLFPVGALAEAPLWLRLAAMATGFAIYFVAGRRVLVGIAATEAVLLAGLLLNL